MKLTKKDISELQRRYQGMQNRIKGGINGPSFPDADPIEDSGAIDATFDAVVEDANPDMGIDAPPPDPCAWEVIGECIPCPGAPSRCDCNTSCRVPALEWRAICPPECATVGCWGAWVTAGPGLIQCVRE